MEPSIAEGDWLLVDPTTARWPRPGNVVAFLEPDSGTLAVKRVAAGPGERIPFGGGYLELADDEAWLVADATPIQAAASGHGAPIDSNQFGPVPVAHLVGRVWFRYAPLGRLGRIRRTRPVLATPGSTSMPPSATDVNRDEHSPAVHTPDASPTTESSGAA
jgi:signal peptidase I